ncbi:MAG TPA: hypothetical protein VFT59_00945 [Candidatus Saccharimonadales bacterium]|nr:hypothetical protein [Candidatus Saccharimonadales bacterium]
MGEAEDVVRRRRAQESAISEEEMREFRILKAWIGELIPQAIENLRRHDYPNRKAVNLRHQGESRVGWQLWYDTEGFGIYLLGDGVLVQDSSTRGENPLYTLTPHSVWPYKINETARAIKEALEFLATTDFS